MHNPNTNNKIIFERPNAKELAEQGFMCIDMHIHSNNSDGVPSVQKIMKKAKQEAFGVAITDHNEIKGSQEAFKLKTNKSPVIPGIEVNCSNGRDILLYFYDIKELDEFYKVNVKDFKGLDPSGTTKVDLYELIDKAHNANCLVVAAHPFGVGHKNTHRIIKKEKTYDHLEKIDALEILNAEFPRRCNMKAIIWNYNLNKSFTGGSDAHTLKEVGSCVTCSKAETFEEFLDNIRKKKNIVVGKESSIRKKFIAYPTIFGKHIKYMHPKLIQKIGRIKLVKKLLRLEEEE